MAAKKSAQGTEAERVLQLLEDLKRLAVLHLINSGVQPQGIARALGVNKSTVSRLVPYRAVKQRSR